MEIFAKSRLDYFVNLFRAFFYLLSRANVRDIALAKEPRKQVKK